MGIQSSLLNGQHLMECYLKRRDYRLDEMLDGHENQMTIFMTDWVI